MEEKHVLNIRELSEYLNCSVSLIRRLINNEKIPYFRLGNKLYFNFESIKEWIKDNEKK